MSRLHLALYQTDAAGRCVWVNSRLCELFEMEQRDVLELGWTRRIHPDDLQRVHEARAHALGPIPTFQIDYRIQVPVAGTRWISAFSTALMEGGTFVGRTGILRDVTDARQAMSGDDRSLRSAS